MNWHNDYCYNTINSKEHRVNNYVFFNVIVSFECVVLSHCYWCIAYLKWCSQSRIKAKWFFFLSLPGMSTMSKKVLSMSKVVCIPNVRNASNLFSHCCDVRHCGNNYNLFQLKPWESTVRLQEENRPIVGKIWPMCLYCRCQLLLWATYSLFFHVLCNFFQIKTFLLYHRVHVLPGLVLRISLFPKVQVLLPSGLYPELVARNDLPMAAYWLLSNFISEESLLAMYSRA